MSPQRRVGELPPGPGASCLPFPPSVIQVPRHAMGSPPEDDGGLTMIGVLRDMFSIGAPPASRSAWPVDSRGDSGNRGRQPIPVLGCISRSLRAPASTRPMGASGGDRHMEVEVPRAGLRASGLAPNANRDGGTVRHNGATRLAAKIATWTRCTGPALSLLHQS